MPGVVGLVSIAVAHNAWASITGRKTICGFAREHPFLATGFCIWLPVHLFRKSLLSPSRES
jgi:hypothetical protein